MATTYITSAIGGKTIHRVRFLIGDTGAILGADGQPVWLVSDEELSALIGPNGETFNGGVAAVCDSLISRFSQEPDKFEDETQTRIEWSNRLKGWEALSKRHHGLSEQPVVGQIPSPVAASGSLEAPPGFSKLGA